MSRSSEGQGHNDACLWTGDDLNNNVCEYEVNQLTNEKLLEEKLNFNANCLRRQTPAPNNRIQQSISWNFLWKIRLKT